MFKCDAKTKTAIRKDSFDTCAYVYRDGVAVRTIESHTYKGERFTKEIVKTFPCEVPIYFKNGSSGQTFTGRLVFQNPTLILDGIKDVGIWLHNQSETMKERGLSCDTVTVHTGSGVQIHEDIFPFLSSDIVIQNDGVKSVHDWDKEQAA
jgi:hypothetical protein